MSTWKNLTAYYDDTHSDNVLMDAATQNLIFVSHVEHAVHEGNYFYIEGYTELDDTDTFYVKLVTPDTTTWAHFTWEISASGILTTELYEGASGGMTGGTAKTPINSNRNSSNTSVMTITSGVTAPTSTGTTISSIKVGSSTGGWRPVISGGAQNPGNEIILKQNTTYCRKFESGSDGNVVYFKATWGEHADKH